MMAAVARAWHRMWCDGTITVETPAPASSLSPADLIWWALWGGRAVTVSTATCPHPAHS